MEADDVEAGQATGKDEASGLHMMQICDMKTICIAGHWNQPMGCRHEDGKDVSAT